MDGKKRILLIDFTNFDDYPVGGYLSFAKSLMESFGNDLALTGITTEKSDPTGKWHKKEIRGTVYDFFAVARYTKSKTKHLIPDRFAGFLLLRYYQKRIFRIKISNVFVQRQEILLAITRLKSLNVCYCFAGLENPLAISKYRYAPFLSGWFEKVFFRKLRSVKTILASGDDKSIREMIDRSNGQLTENRVIKFPTRINITIFKPLARDEARKKLNIPQNCTMLVTTGRIAPLKGWKFLVNCFMRFEYSIPDSVFYFIGEGEDREELKQYIYNNNLDGEIVLAGTKSHDAVALYLNASDLFVMGSYKEGWSTSLMEAIACGVPACVTEFSSASEIIMEGENGFIVKEHREDLFVEAMLKSIRLPRPVKNDNVLKFAAHRLKEDLLKYWELS